MRKGSTPICHYGSPLALYSQIAPSTGRREHLPKSFIDYAFCSGFLGPPSHFLTTTRIAHHCVHSIILFLFLQICWFFASYRPYCRITCRERYNFFEVEEIYAFPCVMLYCAKNILRFVLT
jgi:hypothetical protein